MSATRPTGKKEAAGRSDPTPAGTTGSSLGAPAPPPATPPSAPSAPLPVGPPGAPLPPGPNPADIEGQTFTATSRFPTLTNLLTWVGDSASYVAVGFTVILLVAFLAYDWWVYVNFGTDAVSKAGVGEAEAWIAAAATVGLWATAVHARDLASAIRTLAVQGGAPPGTDSHPPSGVARPTPPLGYPAEPPVAQSLGVQPRGVALSLASKTAFTSIQRFEELGQTAQAKVNELRKSHPNALSDEEWTQLKDSVVAIGFETERAFANLASLDNFLKARLLELQVEKERVLRDTARLAADPEDPVSTWITYLGSAFLAGGTTAYAVIRPATDAGVWVWLGMALPSILLWGAAAVLLAKGLAGLATHRDERRRFFRTNLGPGTEGRI